MFQRMSSIQISERIANVFIKIISFYGRYVTEIYLKGKLNYEYRKKWKCLFYIIGISFNFQLRWFI